MNPLTWKDIKSLTKAVLRGESVLIPAVSFKRFTSYFKAGVLDNREYHGSYIVKLKEDNTNEPF